jgi:ribosomal-protein-alanine N-acetyltransferase
VEPSGAEQGVRVRRYRRADLAHIFALDEICFEPPFRFTLGAMRRFAEAQNALAVVAEDEADNVSRIVGFCILHVELAGGDRIGYIVTLDVAPDHRRRGLARRMMSEMQQRARAAGCCSMALHVSVENEGATRFYERDGYARSHLARSFYGRGRDAWVYRKDLLAAGDDPGE